MVWETVRELERYGVEIERTKDGKIERHPGRGVVNNVMFHGPQMMDTLAKEVRKRNVNQMHKTMMTDLLTINEQVVGALAFHIVDGQWHVFKAKATVLATGGNFYKGRCPGHRNVTGDGHAAAYRAGLDLTGLDLALHNAFAAQYDIGPGMHMYVGSGGKFVNAKGEAFMEKYDPMLKDRVLLGTLSAAFAIEVKQGNAPLYLDMTHVSQERVQRLKRVIPLPMMMYEKAGLVRNDRFVDKIEWMTYAPVPRGGVTVNNATFQARFPGLFACGDAVGWAGAEGGAAALPGGATSGIIAGRAAAEFSRHVGEPKADNEQLAVVMQEALRPIHRSRGVEPDHILLALQEVVFSHDVFLLRHEMRMQRALAAIEDIRDNLIPLMCAYDPHYLRMALEVKNLVTFAEMQVRSSLLRKESRGGTCLREDYPYRDDSNWLKWIRVAKECGEMHVVPQDIPHESYVFMPPPQKILDPIWHRAMELHIVRMQEGQVVWA
jgi:succinate dehydrogenase/fumarate reductase flavoprotein subunit